ncbi:putative 4-hydroxy-4-methyl-2-oxoglutarate aldolase [Kordiimonas sediminis]|uniref:4-hydroxy-4-methyl-2-oxoglutarate aldolase n=1 Tax=Kordiimonas sediminis TaxID=1735581 RepID=A0A919E445_9PROT|nr:ribonuclease E activity regulator RraA [Kordiimonas sediminis]GHF11768.1 putative 4-hydroxy-4-methyl-2-oxoglutarate aldolase [Kordiimonas sediminis]
MARLETPDLPTCDVCDNLGTAATVVPLDFRDYGGKTAFAGPVVTLLAENDNTHVRTMVSTAGNGRVLVVDNGGRSDHALVGGNLAKMAADNGWAGILVYGCVRDRHELQDEPVGIKALGTCPRKTEKLGKGQLDAVLEIAGVTVNPGDWITADADGVVLTSSRPEF